MWSFGAVTTSTLNARVERHRDVSQCRASTPMAPSWSRRPVDRRQRGSSIVVHMSGRCSNWFHDLQTPAALTLHGHRRAGHADVVQNASRSLSGDHRWAVTGAKRDHHCPWGSSSSMRRSRSSPNCWMPATRLATAASS